MVVTIHLSNTYNVIRIAHSLSSLSLFDHIPRQHMIIDRLAKANRNTFLWQKEETQLQSHEYRAILLKAIDLFLENTPQSLSQAHTLVKDGKSTLASATINRILWHGFFGELTDEELTDCTYDLSRRFLLERRQDLLGMSRHFFQAYVGHDYLSAKSTSKGELELFAILHDALNWLSSLQDAQSKDDDRCVELQRTLHLYHSIFPFEEDIYSEKITHFILKMISSIVENVETPSMAFAEYGHLIAMPFRAVGGQGEDEYPSLARDFAWALNALQALQGRSWLSFHWQLLPTNIILIVK